jgi:hypothetical protein
MTTHPGGPGESEAVAGAHPGPGSVPTQRAAEHDTTDLSTASTTELLRRLSTELSELVRGELGLARAELMTKGKRAGAGAGLTGAGGVAAFFGAAALITAAIAGLALALPLWLAALVVGVVLLLVGGVLALLGRNRLRRAGSPVPQRAVRGVQEDVEAVKEAVQR